MLLQRLLVSPRSQMSTSSGEICILGLCWADQSSGAPLSRLESSCNKALQVDGPPLHSSNATRKQERREEH